MSDSQAMTDQATRLGMLVCLCRGFSLPGRFLPEVFKKIFQLILVILIWVFVLSRCYLFSTCESMGQGWSISVSSTKVHGSVVEVVGVNFPHVPSYLLLPITCSYIVMSSMYGVKYIMESGPW